MKEELRKWEASATRYLINGRTEDIVIKVEGRDILSAAREAAAKVQREKEENLETSDIDIWDLCYLCCVQEEHP